MLLKRITVENTSLQSRWSGPTSSRRYSSWKIVKRGQLRPFLSPRLRTTSGLLAQMRGKLSLHLASPTHLDLRSLVGRVFESGDKNGKMLANLVAETRTETVILTIRCTDNDLTSADNNLTSDPASILQEFTNYFGKLYEPVPGPSDAAIQEFLDALDLPILTAEKATLLDWAITTDEIEAAIHSFPA